MTIKMKLKFNANPSRCLCLCCILTRLCTTKTERRKGGMKEQEKKNEVEYLSKRKHTRQ